MRRRNPPALPPAGTAGNTPHTVQSSSAAFLSNAAPPRSAAAAHAARVPGFPPSASRSGSDPPPYPPRQGSAAAGPAGTNNLKLIHCSKEDQALIDKYKPYIYGTHQQIGEFFNLIPWASGISGDEQRKKILEELKYLDENNLINGVKIDDVDGKLIYYTLEKRKTVYNQETVHCPNCGALNDVEITGKVRCAYCKSIVMGSAAKEEIEES